MMSVKKLTLLIVIASILIPLSLYSKIVAPLTILVVALHSLHLEYKIKNLLDSFNVLEETTTKLTNDVNTLFQNQKHLLTILNSLRARINNYYGKISKEQDSSISEKLTNLERREKELSEE